MGTAQPPEPQRKRQRKTAKMILPVRTGTNEIHLTVDPHLEVLFKAFSVRSSKFSREIIGRSGTRATTSSADHARLNLWIARTVFSKWSVEILTYLYAGRGVRFQEIKRALGDISARVLSVKLTRLEELRLVRRTVLDTRPPGVEYSLTEKGLQVARLGEPVLLYLRLTEGLLNPVSP